MAMSFKQSLNFLSARIPTQSMQSFMNTTVVGFLNDHSESNVVFTPVEQMLYQGSDYDVDKSFLMGASIDRNGVYTGWSPFFNYSTERSFNISNDLPIPNKVKLIPSEKSTNDLTRFNDRYKEIINSYYKEDDADIKDYSTEIDLIDLVNIIKGDGDMASDLLELLVDVMNNIDFSDNTYKKTKDKDSKESHVDENLIYLINTHNLYNLSDYIIENSLKNKIYFNIMKICKNPKNILIQTVPMSVELIKRIGSESDNNYKSKLPSADNAATKMISQDSNTIGKANVGITANYNKLYANYLAYIHGAITDNDIRINEDKTVEVINVGKLSENAEYFIKNKFYSYYVSELINNLDIDSLNISEENKALLRNKMNNRSADVSNILKKYNITSLEGDIEKHIIEELLHDIPVKDDMFDNLSLLLTGAVDNAKELVLDKINASKELLPFFVVMLIKGIDFKDICRLMSSGEISLISAKRRSSIIYNTNMNLNDAISHYMTGVNPDRIIEDSYINSLNKLALLFIDSNNLGKVDEKTSVPIIFGGVSKAQYKDSEFQFLSTYLVDLEDKALYNAFRAIIKETPVQNFVKSERIKNKKDYPQSLDEYFDNEEMQQLLDEENDYSGEYEDEMQRAPKVKDIKYQIFRYFDEVIDRKYELKNLSSNPESVANNFRFIKSLNSEISEFKILLKFLKYNQGINVNIEDKIRDIISLEKAVSNSFKKNKELKPSFDKFKEKYDIKTDIIFSIREFVNNLDYRKDIIALYDLSKINVNYLDLVVKSDQYMGILNAINVDYDTLSSYSKKYKELYNILKFRPSIEPTKQNVNYIVDFLNDAMIIKFLKGLDKDFSINNGDTLYKEHNKIILSQGNKLDFSNPDDIKSFKHWVENGFLNDYLRNKYPDNSFVKNLQKSSIKTKLGNTMSVLRMSFDLVLDKNEVNEVINGIIKDFSLIKGTKIKEENGNYTIEDVLYLYNLIVNKEKIGAFTLTNLFKDLSLSDRNSIGAMYTNFIGNISNSSEYSLNTFNQKDYHLEDLYINYPINGKIPKVTIDPDKEELIVESANEKFSHKILYKDNALTMPKTLELSYKFSRNAEQEFLSNILSLISANKLEILLC